MQLLRGTDVVLNGEAVGNVLVGEPSHAAAPFGAGTVSAYTLGIPKGDARDWTGIVGVFGRTFRTVGIPEEGIAANIPTPWHKRVRIEAVCITGAVTFWERETFTRHVCGQVFVRDLRGRRTDKAGQTTSGEMQVYLYAPLLEDGWRPAPGDILVPCVSDLTFDTTDERAVAESMKLLRAANPGYAVVKTAVPIMNGSAIDWEVTAG